MSERKSTLALDYAALLAANALGIETCERRAFDPVAGEEEEMSGVRLAAAISDGPLVELGYCMGASEPYEFEMGALIEVIGAEGDDEATRERFLEAQMVKLGAAIDADPTLGGHVDHAEIEEPNYDAGDHYSAIVATLRLTYTARTALG